MFAKILVAVDNKDGCTRIFDRAIGIAKADNAKVLLVSTMSMDFDLYVNPPMYLGGESISLSEAVMKVYTEEQSQHQSEGLQFLQTMANRAIDYGVAVETIYRMGEPGKIICELANEHHVDLIVVGRRGHNGLNELIMGSVSNYVVHHAPCSVLVVQGLVDDGAK
jgi:nucleotide-binding universal stress UspA family protein